MKIELKKVKELRMASEETVCFEAEIWIDGKKAGEVCNDGKGGCNRYYPHELADRLNAYGKTLPPMVSDYIDSETGKPFQMEQDADLVIGDVLEDFQLRKEFIRLLKNRIIWTRRDGRLYNTKVMKPADLAKDLSDPDRLGEILRPVCVLNLMPVEEAFAVFKKAYLA